MTYHRRSVPGGKGVTAKVRDRCLVLTSARRVQAFRTRYAARTLELHSKLAGP